MDLSHPDRRERLDALAAQYALGTLRGQARDRFTKAARSDPVVAAAAHAWETSLASLAEAVPAVAPPPRVWTGIAARLGLRGAGQAGLSWWQRLGFWRGFALASFAAALVLSLVQLIMITLVSAVAAFWPTGGSAPGIQLPSSVHDWLVVLYLALIASALTMVLQTWAQAHIEPSRAAVIMAMEPVWAAAFAVALGGERITLRMIIGGLAIVSAMYLVERPQKRRLRAKEYVR